MIDRVGGGDPFAGGLSYALKSHFEPQKAIEFALAASCLKHSIEGDYNRVSLDEVNSLMKENATPAYDTNHLSKLKREQLAKKCQLFLFESLLFTRGEREKEKVRICGSQSRDGY